MSSVKKTPFDCGTARLVITAAAGQHANAADRRPRPRAVHQHQRQQQQQQQHPRANHLQNHDPHPGPRRDRIRSTEAGLPDDVPDTVKSKTVSIPNDLDDDWN